jgi:hypothetical protein
MALVPVVSCAYCLNAIPPGDATQAAVCNHGVVCSRCTSIFPEHGLCCWTCITHVLHAQLLLTGDPRQGVRATRPEDVQRGEGMAKRTLAREQAATRTAVVCLARLHRRLPIELWFHIFYFIVPGFRVINSVFILQ